MCGFVAIIGESDSVQRVNRVRKMLSAIAHRGPDDDGLLDTSFSTFGFRRLAILDLSPSGHQPMSSQCGRYSIVFNGEIYNYLELRTELERLGHTFVSRSDTEVLLQAYLHWGETCLTKLNGMWAFLIIDRLTNRIFGSRDRFGIKPLYWYRTTDGVLLVASEVKAIQASGLYHFEPNLTACADYLIDNQLDHQTQSFFQNIYSVGAAQSFVVSADARVHARTYWNFDPFDGARTADPVQTFAQLFESAIELQMRSDVPLGVHLSGGLDSSSIACELTRVGSRLGADGPIVSFSFMDAQFDETEYIKAVLKQTGARHNILHTDAALVMRDLPLTLQAQDEPIHSLTPVIGYQLMKLTADHGIRVVLNGQGADETLGGYGSFFRDAWMTELSKSIPAAWREVQRYAHALGLKGEVLFLNLLKHAAQSTLRRLEPYRKISDQRFRSEQRRQAWLSPHLIGYASGRRGYQAPDLQSQLKQSVTESPLPLYLRTEDRNSMAHSIESRVPFLDHRLVELAFSLGRQWKLDAGLNKVILREAMRGRIPDVVQSRKDKMGFPSPLVRWLRGELQNPMRELIIEHQALTEPFFSSKQVLSMLDQHRDGVSGLEGKIFRAATLGIWLRQQTQFDG